MSSGKCNLVFKIQSPSISWICTGATLVFSDFQLVTKSLVSLKKRPQHTPPLELFGLFQANLKLDHEATTYPCKNERDMERIFQESICDRKTNFYEVKGFLYEAEAVDWA